MISAVGPGIKVLLLDSEMVCIGGSSICVCVCARIYICACVCMRVIARARVYNIYNGVCVQPPLYPSVFSRSFPGGHLIHTTYLSTIRLASLTWCIPFRISYYETFSSSIVLRIRVNPLWMPRLSASCALPRFDIERRRKKDSLIFYCLTNDFDLHFTHTHTHTHTRTHTHTHAHTHALSLSFFLFSFLIPSCSRLKHWKSLMVMNT